jgi:hypothetical protein
MRVIVMSEELFRKRDISKLIAFMRRTYSGDIFDTSNTSKPIQFIHQNKLNIIDVNSPNEALGRNILREIKSLTFHS